MSDCIERNIEISAPVARVWRALVNFREFGAWFGVSLEGEFAPGETARGRITHPGFENIEWKVVVRAIEPESLFSFTWHPYAVDPGVDYSAETPTLVEFRLEAIASGTRLVVTESGFDQVPPSRRDEAYSRHEGGWTQQMKNIERYLA